MLKVSKNIMFRLSTVFDCIRLVSTCLVSWNLSMKQLWDVRSSTDFHRFPQFKADMFVALKAAQYFCYLDHLPPEGVTFPCRWSSDDLFHSSDYFKFFTVSHSFSMFFDVFHRYHRSSWKFLLQRHFLWNTVDVWGGFPDRQGSCANHSGEVQPEHGQRSQMSMSIFSNKSMIIRIRLRQSHVAVGWGSQEVLIFLYCFLIFLYCWRPSNFQTLQPWHQKQQKRKKQHMQQMQQPRQTFWSTLKHPLKHLLKDA